MKPELPLKALADSKVAEHNGWTTIKLQDVCNKIGSGATPRGGKDVYLNEGPYTLIRSQNVYNDGFHRQGLAFIGEYHADQLQNVEVLEKDVLLNITGDSVARICQVAPDILPARVNQHVAIIRPDSVNLDPGYLRYYLTSPETQTMLMSWAGSGGTRNALTKGMIESLEILLPPLPEQRAIAHILGTLDDKIELNRRMNQTLEEMARAIYKDWFVDFGPVRAKLEGQEPYLPVEIRELFPDSLVDSEVGEIPEGWEVKPLGEICTFRAGSAFPKASQGSSSGTYPFAKVSDMNLPENSVSILGSANWVGEDDLSGLKAKPLPKGTTVFAKIGEALKHNRFRLVTIPTIVDNNMMGAIPDANLIEPLILFHALSGFDMGEIAGGTALPYLTINTLASLLIPIPPAKQQRVMGEPLKAFHEKSVANARESLQLSEKRESLLQKLVSGEIRVGS